MAEAIQATGNKPCEVATVEGVGHFFERVYFGCEFERVAGHTLGWFDNTG